MQVEELARSRNSSSSEKEEKKRLGIDAVDGWVWWQELGEVFCGFYILGDIGNNLKCRMGNEVLAV